MNPHVPLDPGLLEALSAYLDGRLEGVEQAALEERLARDADLRRQLSELRAVRDSLRGLPSLKPPRPLILTRQQVGMPVGRGGWFSARSLGFGSVLAAMAFVFVASINMLSYSGMAAAPRPVAEKFAAPAALQSADQSVPGGTAGNSATFAPLPTSLPPAPTADGAREGYGGGGGEMPTVTPAVTETPVAGCGAPPEADALAAKCGLNGNDPDQEYAPSFSPPDFQTLAPYLEMFLGVSAIILAILAIRARRRLH
jgi:hypothetical protein